jgi:hypothetical protein
VVATVVALTAMALVKLYLAVLMEHMECPPAVEMSTMLSKLGQHLPAQIEVAHWLACCSTTSNANQQ